MNIKRIDKKMEGMMLDNNFDNNEELEIVNITEDESKAEEEVKEEKKTTYSAGEEEKESEYEDVCFICRRPESRRHALYLPPRSIFWPCVGNFLMLERKAA